MHDSKSNMAGHSNGEAANESWDQDLYDLVASRPDALVKPSWLFGAEMALGPSMSYANISRETVHAIAAEVRQLLESPATGTEEAMSTGEPEVEEFAETEGEELVAIDVAIKEDNTKSETQKEPVNLSKAITEKLPENQSSREAESLAPSDSASKESYEYDDGKAIVAKIKAVSNTAQSEQKQPIKPAAKNNVATKAPNIPPSKAIIASTPKVLAAKDSPNKNAVINEVISHPAPVPPMPKQPTIETRSFARPETRANPPVPKLKILEVNTGSKDFKPDIEMPQLVEDEEISSPILYVPVETTAEPEQTEVSILDIDDEIYPDNTAKLINTESEITKDEPILRAYSYQVETEAPTDFGEEEIILLNPVENNELEPVLYDLPNIIDSGRVEDSTEPLEEALILEPISQTSPADQIEATNHEQIVQPSLTIEEVEVTLAQLSGVINSSEPEKIEKINEVLAQIIEAPSKLEASNSEGSVTEAEAQKELEELFTELFINMDVDYTPELIESLAHLTTNWHLADELKHLKIEEENHKLSKDHGTHEIIKRLLAGISNLKKAILQAGAIGRSALQLYRFSLAAAA